MLNLNKFDNEQLGVLNSYIDNYDVLRKLCSCIDYNYTSQQIEIIGKAISLGLDVTNILNPKLSSECMILLCDAIKKGIDVRGLDNPNVDVSLLKKIIGIRLRFSGDMSFIKKLSFSQCREFVNYFNNDVKFDLGKVKINRKGFCLEIKNALGNVK